jgi:hypothetical protein
LAVSCPVSRTIAVIRKRLDGFTLIESNPRSVRNLPISGYFAGLGAWERPGYPRFGEEEDRLEKLRCKTMLDVALHDAWKF